MLSPAAASCPPGSWQHRQQGQQAAGCRGCSVPAFLPPGRASEGRGRAAGGFAWGAGRPGPPRPLQRQPGALREEGSGAGLGRGSASPGGAGVAGDSGDRAWGTRPLLRWVAAARFVLPAQPPPAVSACLGAGCPYLCRSFPEIRGARLDGSRAQRGPPQLRSVTEQPGLRGAQELRGHGWHRGCLCQPQGPCPVGQKPLEGSKAAPPQHPAAFPDGPRVPIQPPPPHTPRALGRPQPRPNKALAPPWGICSRSRAKGGRAGCGALRAASPPHVPSRPAGPAASTGLQQPGGVGAVGRMRAARAPRGPSAFPAAVSQSTQPEVSAGFNTVSDTPAGPPPDRPGPLSAFQSQPGPAAASQPSTRGRRRHRCCPRGHGPKVPPAPSHAPAWQCQPSPLSYCHSRLLRHREAPGQHTKGKIRLQKGSGMGLSARCTWVVQPAPAAAPPGPPRGHSPAPRATAEGSHRLTLGMRDLQPPQ